MPKLADKLKQAIIDGKIDIQKLAEMTSQERRSFFTEFFGNETTAKEVNALFESKTLLKNQIRGMVNWAKQITGIKPEVKRDLISRIQKMDKVLSPEDQTKFLEDLASKRLGTDISIEEASKIMELSNNIKKLENFTNDKERITYGRAKLELSNYVNSLNPQKADLITNIAGVPRSLMASLDLSAPLNQGWGMLSRKQFYTSFKDMFKYLKSDKNLADLQADIITRPTYKQAKKAGLRLTDLGTNLEKREEQFMSTLIDKIPFIKGSQRAYTGFLNKLRMDVFDDLLKKAEVLGEDISTGSKVIEDLAKVVNNFTGGARVGKIEGAVPALNAAFFSPRKIMSTINILNPKNYISKSISPTARKAAIRNLIGSAAMTASLISLARLLGSEKPETDPRSTNFGKIKVGDTTLDVSGGNATYATLMSRILSGSTKKQSGDIVPLSNKIGGTSAIGLIGSSIRYKFSPNLSLLVDSLTGANAIGEEKTIPQSVADRFKPMFLNSLVELLDSDTSGKLLFSLGALFGGGLNTYDRAPKTKSSKKQVSDALDNVKLIAKALLGSQEDAKKLWDESEPILAKGVETNTRLSSQGLITKNGDKYIIIDPSGFVGSLKNIAGKVTKNIGSKIVYKAGNLIDELDPKNFKTAEDYVKAQATKDGVATRFGEISKDGAYFSKQVDGFENKNYFNAKTGNIKNSQYDISKANIVKSDTKEALTVLKEALKDSNNTPQDIIRLNREINSANEYGGKAIIDWRLNDEIPSIVKSAKKLGYDGINVIETGDVSKPTSLFIWNTNKINELKTKSQLISEWNKAQPLKNPLIQEAKKYKSASEIRQRIDELDNIINDGLDRKTGSFKDSKSYNAFKERQSLLVEEQKLQNKLISSENKLKEITQQKADTKIRQLDPNIDKLSEADKNILINEIKKHSTLDEFTSKMRGSATQYGDYSPKLRKFVRPESVVMGDIKGLNPETVITVYRGIDAKSVSGKSIRNGDFVTTDYNDALAYTDSPSKVVSLRTKLKNLVAEYPDEVDISNPLKPVSYELLYNRGGDFVKITDSKLIELWNKANGKIKLK